MFKCKSPLAFIDSFTPHSCTDRREDRAPLPALHSRPPDSLQRPPPQIATGSAAPCLPSTAPPERPPGAPAHRPWRAFILPLDPPPNLTAATPSPKGAALLSWKSRRKRHAHSLQASHHGTATRPAPYRPLAPRPIGPTSRLIASRFILFFVLLAQFPMIDLSWTTSPTPHRPFKRVPIFTENRILISAPHFRRHAHRKAPRPPLVLPSAGSLHLH